MSKAFVSLSFTPTKLQVVQLDSAKKKVVKFGSFDIPTGLIANYHVMDSKKLSEVIKSALSSLKISEKSVGLVVPEFSTFTKLVKVPILQTGEMDEAVRWQAKEFMGEEGGGNMIMDWKVVRSDEREKQALLVAIDKGLLLGYINAVGFAGLYPLVVETQSLSLVRVTDSESVGKLVIYKNFGEVVLMMSRGWKILGSSVVGAGNDDAIISTISGMVRHYEEVKIGKIVVAGTGFTQDFYTKVQELIKLPIEGVKVSVTGISESQFQEYLLPISLSFCDPLEPRDENSVNLLPPDWVDTYDKKRLKLRVWGLAIAATLVIAGSLAAVLTTNFFLNTKLNDLLDESEVQMSGVNDELMSQVNEINNLANSVSLISKASVLPQDVINPITQSKPEGVSITKYSLDLDKGAMTLTGVAVNRQVLIDFKKSLEEVTDFVDVRIPIHYLEKEIDVEFEISFSYLPIKEKPKIKLKLN